MKYIVYAQYIKCNIYIYIYIYIYTHIYPQTGVSSFPGLVSVARVNE